MIITLEDLKRHLVIEHSEDDAYLNDLIAIAEVSINNHIRRAPVTEYEKPLQHAARLLCGNWYNNRESVSDRTLKEIPHTYEYLISQYINYNQ